ncbi:hypothetical protein H310_05211 [Aphanomyces invadans]|uniref:Uncharacterized protein n=1 Tax=Aphanomyces invadans TaxID=157072 RepID=A0A024UBV0_9STRA|nr:hypothetical protein H310_05211 [Aphanomyces invadans]ETW03861.1 hypothetical protein H310_05211 [Aphanomyces invadans]|eukprot:XP_008868090.1 hypothetical protein H310_05211 [Aphanomyces invadans]
MKVPDEALLRGRSKAPLDDVEVLYLSGCALDGVAHLDACTHLHSLHLAHNRLVDIAGLRSLRTLWHINLSYNARLHDLSPLADFAALGFLSLEHCMLTFDDVAALRDMHIAELRLHGNPPLLLGQDADQDEATYRLKTAALLPNVWVLDGHYITTDQRLLALETFGEFEFATTQGRTDRYGSTAMTWQLLPTAQSNHLADHLLHVVSHQPTSRRILRESYRLKAVLHMYAHLATHVNAHLYLAPPTKPSSAGCAGHHSATNPSVKAQPWPVLPTDAILHMPPRARLNLAILVAATLDFPSLPPFLVLEAATINLVGQLDAADVRAVLEAPPYVATALLFLLGEQGLKDNLSLPENDRKLWSSLPVILSTFAPSSVAAHSTDDSDHPDYIHNDQLFTRRCCYAVILLSRAPSFPTHGAATSSSVAVAVAASLQPLLDKAKMRVQDLVPDSSAASSSSSSMSAWIGSQKRLDGIRSGNPEHLPWNKPSNNDRSSTVRYPRPWAAQDHASATAPANNDSTENAAPGQGRASTPASDTHRNEPAKSSAFSKNYLQHARSSVQLQDCSSRRRGKLHRDAHGFHKEGVPRSFGVPNADLSAQDLMDVTAVMGLLPTSTKPVELFATNTSWNANYVLAPPALVLAQNMWMGKQQSDGAGWSRMGVIPARTVESTQNLVPQPRPLGPTRHAMMYMAVNGRKDGIPNVEDSDDEVAVPQQVDGTERTHSDGGMQELQRDLAMLLGKVPGTTDNTSPSFFMTQGGSHDQLATSSTAAMPGKRGRVDVSVACQHQRRSYDSDAGKPARKAGFKTWYAVAAKSELVVPTLEHVTGNNSPQRITTHSNMRVKKTDSLLQKAALTDVASFAALPSLSSSSPSATALPTTFLPRSSSLPVL